MRLGFATMTNGQVNLLHEKHLKLERSDAGRVHISVTRVTGNVLILAQDYFFFRCEFN